MRFNWIVRGFLVERFYDTKRISIDIASGAGHLSATEKSVT